MNAEPRSTCLVSAPRLSFYRHLMGENDLYNLCAFIPMKTQSPRSFLACPSNSCADYLLYIPTFAYLHFYIRLPYCSLLLPSSNFPSSTLHIPHSFLHPLLWLQSALPSRQLSWPTRRPRIDSSRRLGLPSLTTPLYAGRQ